MIPTDSQPSGLMPQGQSPGPNASPTPPADEHKLAMAQWQKINQAYKLTQHVVKALIKLNEMGDIIEPDDVVDSTAGLVGHGAMSAKEAAAGLSDMPTTPGAALASWVANHKETFQNHLEQLKQANNVATHQVVVTGLSKLAQSHLQGQMAPQTPVQNSGSPMGNSLSPMVH